MSAQIDNHNIAESTNAGWKANLKLEYSKSAFRTVISHRKHFGPLIIQKPFYPEDNVCHTYLIHPPGGVVGGDRIDLSVKVNQGAHALITTPAANKFYRSAGSTAEVTQEIIIENDAIFEWLPQENIFFDGSKVAMTTRIELGESTHFIGWEMTCLGRPASGDNFNTGNVFQKFEIWKNSKPLLLDRVDYQSEGAFRTEMWAMGNDLVTASMVAMPATKGLLNELREHVDSLDENGLRIGASLINDMLVCRGIADDAETLREALFSIWAVIRPHVTGKPACLPRIWNT